MRTFPLSLVPACAVVLAVSSAAAQIGAPGIPHVNAVQRLQIGAVWIVDAAGGGSFTQIQPAVDAAESGDVVLVKAGTYAPFTLAGKGISIVEDNGIVANVTGDSFVRDIPANELALVAGLTIFASTPTAALAILDSPGPVRIQRVALFGADAAPGAAGGAALHVSQALDLALTGVELFGGRGAQSVTADGGGFGGDAIDSKVAIYGCTVEGGLGGDGIGAVCGHAGGIAFRHENGALFAAASWFRGGVGGSNDDCSVGCGGDGGSGLVVDALPPSVPLPLIARLLDNVYAGGAGGAHVCGSHGSAGPDTGGTGGVQFLSAASRVVLSPTPVRDAGATQMTFYGEPDDAVFLLVSTSSAHEWSALLNGVLLVGTPTTTQLTLGTIPASGTLSVAIPLSDSIAPPGRAVRLHAQALFVPPQGPIVLGNPSTLVVLDHVF